ncbi:MAG: hypothetical protein KGI50_00480 [Patescibacteria group bacterium]|nr:hypothetical protein [Patescibacteria group bacterium]MDE2438168.1 hypothetical protein [Patescibacteria group bacterium]
MDRKNTIVDMLIGSLLKSEEDEAGGEERLTSRGMGQVLGMVGELQGGLDEVRRYFPIAKLIIDGLKGDVTTVLKMAAGAYLDVAEGMPEEAKRFAALRARGIRNLYESLSQSGFSDEDAYGLTLAALASDSAIKAQQKANGLSKALDRCSSTTAAQVRAAKS